MPQEVTLSRARFPKPAHNYKSISLYGSNIVASEGEEWKKYRKISAPAFSDVRVPDHLFTKSLLTPLQRNNKLVWDETVKIMNGLFSDFWMDRDVINIDHAVDLTLPV